MTIKAITKPSVVVNGTNVGIVANSLVFNRGDATKTINVQSAGGNSVENIVSQDLSTAKGKVMFKLKPTTDNIALRDTWAEATTIEVQISDEDTGYRTSMNGVMTNSPDVACTPDGEIDIDIQGTQLT